MFLNRILAGLPIRQKRLITITVISGIVILVLSIVTTIPNEIFFFYSFGVSISLLGFNALVDLNEKSVFRTWYVLSAIIFLVSLLGYNDERFLILRSSNFIADGVNRYLSDYSVNCLKSLFVFLTFYWIINKLYNRKGLYVINTFRQPRWYHDGAKRKITGIDVLINLFLLFIILLSCLF